MILLKLIDLISWLLIPVGLMDEDLFNQQI